MQPRSKDVPETISVASGVDYTGPAGAYHSASPAGAYFYGEPEWYQRRDSDDIANAILDGYVPSFDTGIRDYRTYPTPNQTTGPGEDINEPQD